MRGAEFLYYVIEINEARSEQALWWIERRLATNGDADDRTRQLRKKLHERRQMLVAREG